MSGAEAGRRATAGGPDGATGAGSTGQGAGRAVLVAPAKLTVSLRLTGVRADGYHLLDAEMVTLDLADTLYVTDGDGFDLSLEHLAHHGPAGKGGGGSEPSLGVPGEPSLGVPDGDDNLVRRALAAVGRSAHVVLVKRIPPGAGLGGGSADAAAILRWAGCDDLAVAARLGADVPFCVVGGRARVTGIGEVVAPLPYVERSFVLALPPFGVDTPSVYRAADELAAARGGTWGRGDLGPGSSAREEATNDLEEAALLVEPRLGAWRDALAEATGARPRLAGSGSTWFVEGGTADVGLAGEGSLTVGGATGRLVVTRTVPPERDGTAVACADPAAGGG